MSRLERFQLRMYGTYLCSCGCGKPLGQNTVFNRDGSVCWCVGEVDDEAGYKLRSFRQECWDNGISNMSDTDIYAKYPTAPLNDKYADGWDEIDDDADDAYSNAPCDTYGPAACSSSCGNYAKCMGWVK